MREKNWLFSPKRRTDSKGKTLAIDNFQQEDKEFPNIFFREVIQNVLDARRREIEDGRCKHAHLDINLLGLNGGLSKEVLQKYTGDIEGHLNAAGHSCSLEDNLTALVIEEIGTTGLTGKTVDSHYESSETDQRWNNFWGGEGLEVKTKKSLGRRGQGKITYHLASDASSVFAYTNQEKGGATGLLFGKCIFKGTYKYEEVPYNRHAYFCSDITIDNDKQPIPITDKSVINDFITDFNITRKEQPGTSWVIPHVSEGIMNKESIVRAIVSEFYIAINNEDISFSVDGIMVNKEYLFDIFDTYEVFKNAEDKEFAKWLISVKNNELNLFHLHKCWFVGANQLLNEKALDDEDITSCRSLFEKQDSIAFRVPIPVTRKGEKENYSHVTVFIQSMPDNQKTTESYIRDCLIIEQERYLRGVPGKFFGAVIAEDESIVDFLGSAEEASHLKWNPKAASLSDKYEKHQDTLSMVRRSLPILAGFLIQQESKVYDDVFSSLMAIPSPSKDLPLKPKKKLKLKKKPKSTPRPRSSYQVEVSQEKGKLKIESGSSFFSKKIPLELNITLAYATLSGEGDAFNQYHWYDFDLSNKKLYPIDAIAGCNVLYHDNNTINIEIVDPVFELNIEGFTDDILLIRVNS